MGQHTLAESKYAPGADSYEKLADLSQTGYRESAPGIEVTSHDVVEIDESANTRVVATDVVRVDDAERRLQDVGRVNRLIGAAAIAVFRTLRQGSYVPVSHKYNKERSLDAWLINIGSENPDLDPMGVHRKVDTALGRAARDVALWAANGATNTYRDTTQQTLREVDRVQAEMPRHEETSQVNPSTEQPEQK